MVLIFSLRWNRITTTTNARRASPPRTPPTIAPVSLDAFGLTFEIADDEAEAEDKVGVVEIGGDEVAEDVEDANVTDGLAPLRAELLSVRAWVISHA